MSRSSEKVDLFLVGAMKSGTTTLARQLDQHPEVFMSQDPWKEPRYFVSEMNLSRGLDWYHDLYRSAPSACRVWGEASQHYAWYPHYRGVPERIAEYNPDGRILYIIRDPVERAISHYWWDVQWSGEGRSMLEAFQAMPCLTDVSNYALQLDRYRKLFSSRQIKVVTLESLRDSPEATLADIFDWLGVDPHFDVPNARRRENVSTQGTVERAIGAPLFSRLRGGGVWKTAKRVLPQTVRQRMLAMLSRPVEKTKPSFETLDYLRQTCLPQVESLSRMLEREFPEWTTLYSSDTVEPTHV